MEYSSNGRPAVAALTGLDRVTQLARELTGARYVALAILNERGTGLEHFLTAGVDEETRRAIGHPPRGHGLLGRLILDPHPLRIADVRKHPSSYGFPEGHPVMRSFLGVPVMIRGRAWGSLHLADIAPRQASRVPAAGWLPGLDALDWAPAFDSESHVEHDAAVCHASDGVEVSLDDLRGLYEQESEAQDQLAERRTIEQRAAAESLQLGGDPLGGVDQLVGFCVGDRQQAERGPSAKTGPVTAGAER
jgi:GAF domain-containing protein